MSAGTAQKQGQGSARSVMMASQLEVLQKEACITLKSISLFSLRICQQPWFRQNSVWHKEQGVLPCLMEQTSGSGHHLPAVPFRQAAISIACHLPGVAQLASYQRSTTVEDKEVGALWIQMAAVWHECHSSSFGFPHTPAALREPAAARHKEGFPQAPARMNSRTQSSYGNRDQDS